MASTTTSQLATIATKEMVDIFLTPEKGPKQPANVKFLPDTGAHINAIPNSDFRRTFKSVPLEPAADPVTAVGTVIKNYGSFKATMDWKANDGQSRPVVVDVHVLHDLNQPVLSKATQQEIGMISKDYPHARVNQVDVKRTSTKHVNFAPLNKDKSLHLPHHFSSRTRWRGHSPTREKLQQFIRPHLQRRRKRTCSL